MSTARPRIDLLAPPFAGHLHPIIAMGCALKDLAEVRVLSTEAAQDRIRLAGLQGDVVLPKVDARLRAITDPPYRVGSHPLRLHAQFDASLNLLEAIASALRERYALERPDLVIADFTLSAVGPVANRHDIHWWTSHPSPCVIEAPGGPQAYLGGLLPGRGWLGQLRDRSAGLAVHGFKRMIGRLYARRLHALGFEELYREDGSEAAYSPQRILALGLREFEFARRWPDTVDFIGPLLWSPPALGPPPPSVESTRPHILVTLGTHLGFAKPALVAELEAIAAANPQWCIHFSVGRLPRAAPTQPAPEYAGERAQGANPYGSEAGNMGKARPGTERGSSDASPAAGRLQQHAWVDYPSWIPRMQAVVHHGGAGVLWECLRAGVPQLVLPQDYDQFDHAARLKAAGVGVRLHAVREVGDALEACLASDNAAKAQVWMQALQPGMAESRLYQRVRRQLGV